MEDIERRKDRRLSVRAISLGILFVLVFPLVIFLGIGSISQFRTLQEKEQQQKLLQYQDTMRQMEAEIETADSFVTSLVLESAALRNLCYSASETQTFLDKEDLFSTFGSFLSQNPRVYAIAVYCPQTGNYLERDSRAAYPELTARLAFRNALEKYLKALDDGGARNQPMWFTLCVEGEYFLCKTASLDGAWSLCCVSLSMLTQWMEENSLYHVRMGVWEGETCLLSPGNGVSIQAAGLPEGKICETGAPKTLAVKESAFGLSWVVFLENTHTEEVGTAYTLLQMIITICGFVGMLAAYIIWRKSFLQPLEGLKHTMRQIKNGNLETHAVGERAGREMHEINTTFNDMMRSIWQLKIERYEKELQAKQAQLDFYKVQIRPHFYLNCLKNSK